MLWSTNAAISFLFPIPSEAPGSTRTFGIFVVVNVASIVFVRKMLPENKGRSLEELEDQFRDEDLEPETTPAT